MVIKNLKKHYTFIANHYEFILTPLETGEARQTMCLEMVKRPYYLRNEKGVPINLLYSIVSDIFKEFSDECQVIQYKDCSFGINYNETDFYHEVTKNLKV